MDFFSGGGGTGCRLIPSFPRGYADICDVLMMHTVRVQQAISQFLLYVSSIGAGGGGGIDVYTIRNALATRAEAADPPDISFLCQKFLFSPVGIDVAGRNASKITIYDAFARKLLPPIPSPLPPSCSRPPTPYTRTGAAVPSRGGALLHSWV